MPSAIQTDIAGTETTLTSPRRRRSSVKVLSRNIRQVVLGNHQFDTWYYSPYPDAIIRGPDVLNKNATNGDVRLHRTQSPAIASNDEPGCSCLYVCPHCFRYSPVKHDYVLHLRHHENSRKPGEDMEIVPASAVKVYEWEGYTVWDVDGEREKLYCQNLSLFGKLFLEQKSVFFDTAGFHYYVLTYTSAERASPSAHTRGHRPGSSQRDSEIRLTTVTMGFFSKENLSWDSNNLACILVFPPFQHRQLGQLLMAVSYKLSGWEWEGGVIGGPEKPLSAMGRKSYLRFWSERIARFMIGQTADADSNKIFDKTGKNRAAFGREELTIKELGLRTGMLVEDVVAALNEMGVCQPRLRKRKKGSLSETNGEKTQSANEEHEPFDMIVPQSGILKWASDNHVDIIAPVKEEGFLGEWALSDTVDDEDASIGEDEVPESDADE